MRFTVGVIQNVASILVSVVVGAMILGTVTVFKESLTFSDLVVARVVLSLFPAVTEITSVLETTSILISFNVPLC
jgi:hypothetical protein